MRVYAPTHEAVVLVSGGESTVDRVRSVLSRFLGGLAVLLLASLLLQAAVVGLPDLDSHGASEPAGGGAPADDGARGDGNAGGAPAGPTPTPTASFVQSGDESGGDAGQPTATAVASGGSATQYEDGDGAATGTPTATATRTTTPESTGPGRSPVVYFLAGGVFVLVVSAARQYRRR